MAISLNGQLPIEDSPFHWESTPHTLISQAQATIDSGPDVRDADLEYFGLPPLDPDTPSNPAIDSTNESDATPPLMGLDDPFSIVADLGRNLFAGGSAVPQTTYVPVVSGGGSGGGSSAMLLLLVVALIGGAAWWYFKGRKSNAGAS